MRTPLLLIAIAAVALGPAAAASAKEISAVKVCGADGCHDVTDQATMAVTDGGPPTKTPARAMVRSGPRREASSASTVRTTTSAEPATRRCRSDGFWAQAR